MPGTPDRKERKRMIDARLLSLLAVNDTGSFTRAAEKLSLSQPAVSQHIRQLENELQVHLFERMRGQLHLTREGQIVVKYARRMQALHHNLLEALTTERTRITSLTVGITHTAESNAIAEALARYVTLRERMSVKMITGSMNDLFEALKNFELDLAVVEGSVSDPRFRSVMLDTDWLILAVAPEHPLARHSIVSIEELKQEKLILRLPDSGTRSLFISALETHDLHLNDFNVVLEIDNIATIKDLIRRGFGVSVLARSACMDELGKGKIVALPIEDLTMMRQINLVYSKDFDHPEVLRDIVRCYNELIPNKTD